MGKKEKKEITPDGWRGTRRQEKRESEGMFVPFTQNSELAKALREAEDKLDSLTM